MAGRIAPTTGSYGGLSLTTQIVAFFNAVISSTQGSGGSSKEQSCTVVMESLFDHRPAKLLKRANSPSELNSGREERAESFPGVADASEVVRRLKSDRSQLTVGDQISELEQAIIQPSSLPIHLVTSSTDKEQRDRIEVTEIPRNAEEGSEAAGQSKAHGEPIDRADGCLTNQKDEVERETLGKGGANTGLDEKSPEESSDNYDMTTSDDWCSRCRRCRYCRIRQGWYDSDSELTGVDSDDLPCNQRCGRCCDY